jgi:thioredoxin reductase (NADPH)
MSSQTTPVVDASVDVLTVAGYAGCPHFQKTANVVAAIEHLVGSEKVRARIIEHKTRDEFAAWARNALASLDTAGVEVNEMTSPLCYRNKTEYIGSAEDALRYFKAAFLGRGGAPAVRVINVDNAPGAASYDYDLLVIGGGSGGMACSKEAARLGAKVCLCDFVKPSPLGTKWGLGGTCVNVGCIPKKLMHNASLLREAMEDAAAFGWESSDGAPAPTMNWPKMVQAVQNHIKSLNFKYRVELREKSVAYEKRLAAFTEDPHTFELTDAKGDVKRVTARRVVVAVGGRPTPLRCAGGELALSSDDIFSLKTPPGKTCIVGASYIALECAGFLVGMGFDVTVMVRSILLRGFDRDCAERIARDMQAKGVKFLFGVVPDAIEETAGGRKRVTWTSSNSKDVDYAAIGTPANGTDEFDTVFGAIGRSADTAQLGVDRVGIKCNPRNGKIYCQNEQTNIPHIYAIGDVMEGCPELTPVAIQAGKLLAKRLFQDGFDQPMDYHHVATTVFTPLEYGTIGYSEEEATRVRGADNLEVFHRVFVPLEWTVPHHRPDNLCYAKLICDKKDDLRVIGLHFCGPNAGEVTQGWALAMKCGATYDDFFNTVGIHPTTAEELTILSVTKASGEDAEGGSC